MQRFLISRQKLPFSQVMNNIFHCFRNVWWDLTSFRGLRLHHILWAAKVPFLQTKLDDFPHFFCSHSPLNVMRAHAVLGKSWKIRELSCHNEGHLCVSCWILCREHILFVIFYQQWIAQVIEMFLVTDKESLILNDMAADGLTTQRTNAWSALG